MPAKRDEFDCVVGSCPLSCHHEFERVVRSVTLHEVDQRDEVECVGGPVTLHDVDQRSL
jgi:hypothetical protein